MNNKRSITLSPQGYGHLITLLQNEKKQALRWGIGDTVFGVAVIVIAVVFWGFAVTLNYQAYSDSGLVTGFIFVLIALGIALLFTGIIDLANSKMWEREIKYFTMPPHL